MATKIIPPPVARLAAMETSKLAIRLACLDSETWMTVRIGSNPSWIRKGAIPIEIESRPRPGRKDRPRLWR